MSSFRGDSQFVLVGRAIWMMFGPAAIFTTGAVILTSSVNSWLSAPSLIYLVALIMTVVGRWIECAGGVPKDSSGNPIDRKAVTRWSAAVLFGGGATWLVLNLLNHFLFR